MGHSNHFPNSEPVAAFRERPLPVPARLAGYSALFHRFSLDIPLHHTMAAVSSKNTRRKEDGWAIYPVALSPGSSIIDHLVFALKYEGVQLLALKRVFQAFNKVDLERAALERPTSIYLRRLCYLYEWLLELSLDIPDTTASNYVPLLDPEQQYGTGQTLNSKRFRVKDNLPGTRLFCPLVFRTKGIDRFRARGLSKEARQVVDSASPELISRAAAFLLLADSKASFAIEGERPSNDRIARWGGVLGKAGQIRIDREQLEILQREIIGDNRFVTLGLRAEGGFVGRHDAFQQPDPEHISARADNLAELVAGLTLFNQRSADFDYEPVLAAASLAFGFVYIHPFEDGNGRIHRFLLHHVLSHRAFTPPGIVLPVSSVMYREVARYKDVLETTSKPLLDHVVWKSTAKGNIEVISESADFYRYFDATAHADYLFKCIARVVEQDLPEELAFLEHRDAFHGRVTAVVDMGERTIDLLLNFLRQNGGRLSKRALTGEFKRLTSAEVEAMEGIYADLFA